MVSKLIHFITTHPRRCLMIAGLILALMGFEEVYDDVFHDPMEGDYEAQTFDTAISKIVVAYRSPEMTQVMTDLTALGSVSVIATLFIICVAVLASYRDLKGIIFVSIVLAGGGLLPYFLKPLFSRERPPSDEFLAHVATMSFPSGHSFGAAAAYLAFAYYASRYTKSWKREIFFYTLALILAALIGISRIYLGVHYPTDILAGLSGGIAWGLSAIMIFEALEQS